MQPAFERQFEHLTAHTHEQLNQQHGRPLQRIAHRTSAAITSGKLPFTYADLMEQYGVDPSVANRRRPSETEPPVRGQPPAKGGNRDFSGEAAYRKLTQETADRRNTRPEAQAEFLTDLAAMQP